MPMKDDNRPEDLVSSSRTIHPGFLLIKFASSVHNIQYSVQTTQRDTPFLSGKGLRGEITGRVHAESFYTVLVPTEEHLSYFITVVFEDGKKFTWVV